MSRRQALIAWFRAAGAAGRAIAQSAVSVYLPEYGVDAWAALHGSILTRTVFCAEQAPGCNVAGDLPFVFTEGAHTLTYSGSAPGTLTANLECQLDGTTVATCTGSSSFGSDYWEGTVTGPTQTVWTRTFTAAEVTWGVLTLTTPAPLPGTADIDGAVEATVASAPIPTSRAAGLPERRRVMTASIGVDLSRLLWA
ncbi:hypothetical protein VTK56DRAFT_7553 [Thermocarpiscus australiensis]